MARRSAKPSTVRQTQSRSARVEDEQWYHGLMPRQDINRMLRKQGDFIVRKTEVEPGTGKMRHVLSIYWDKKTKHVVLHERDGRHLIDKQDKDFASISELVNHYWKTGTKIPRTHYVLSNPVPRQEWELRHEDIRLCDKLGEGNFGEVYRGELCRPGKEPLPVAIKKNNLGDDITKEQVNEFIAENYRMPLPFDWPFQIRTIIDQCWQQEPDRRPTMAQLCERLLQAQREMERNN